jgi:hypothetical protein
MPGTPDTKPTLFYVDVEGVIAVIANDAAQATKHVSGLGSFELAENVGATLARRAKHVEGDWEDSEPYVASGVDAGDLKNLTVNEIFEKAKADSAEAERLQKVAATMAKDQLALKLDDPGVTPGALS